MSGTVSLMLPWLTTGPDVDTVTVGVTSSAEGPARDPGAPSEGTDGGVVGSIGPVLDSNGAVPEGESTGTEFDALEFVDPSAFSDGPVAEPAVHAVSVTMATTAGRTRPKTLLILRPTTSQSGPAPDDLDRPVGRSIADGTSTAIPHHIYRWPHEGDPRRAHSNEASGNHTKSLAVTLWSPHPQNLTRCPSMIPRSVTDLMGNVLFVLELTFNEP